MSDSDSSSFGGKAAKGGIATIAGQILRTTIQLVSIVVLSRLLLPEDYGLLAMVLVVVGIGEMVRDFGLSTASVQAKELSDTQRNTMFWANTLIGAVLTVIGVALAVPVAAFYSNNDLIDLMRVVSFTFVINGVAAQFKAHLVRGFRFVANTVTDIIGQLTGLAVAIIVASMGGGFWALAAQQIVQGAVSLFCLVLTARWLPGLSVRLAESRALFKFGWNYTATNLLVYFSTNVSTVILGKLFSPAELGLYNRAFQLANMPYSQVSAPIGNVAIPILSRVQQERESFSRLLLRGQAAVSNLMVGGYCLAIGVMAPAVDVAFGDEWNQLAPLLQILAIGSMSQSLMFSSYWAFVSLGLTGSNLRFALVTRPVLLAFVAGGSFFGPYGAAGALSIGLVLMWPAALLWLKHFHNLRVRDLFYSASRMVTLYGLCGFATWIAASRIASSWLALSGGVIVFLAMFAVCLLIVKPFRREFVDVVSVVRKRR